MPAAIAVNAAARVPVNREVVFARSHDKGYSTPSTCDQKNRSLRAREHGGGRVAEKQRGSRPRADPHDHQIVIRGAQLGQDGGFGDNLGASGGAHRDIEPIAEPDRILQDRFCVIA